MAVAIPALADLPGLYVAFHSDHTFAVTFAAGQAVGTTSGAPTVIAAGTYKLFVDDTSDTDSEFDLAGPGVKLVTNMSHGEDATAAFVETFQPNSVYTYRDDNHPSLVWTFVTSAAEVGSSSSGGSSGSSPGGTSTGASTGTSSGKPTTSSDLVGSEADLPFRGSLDAIVYASGKLTLTRSGKLVKSLKTGKWTFSVDDESTKAGFSVQVLHGKVQTITSASYKGSHDVTLTLTPGRWAFFTPGGKQAVFYVVS